MVGEVLDFSCCVCVCVDDKSVSQTFSGSWRVDCEEERGGREDGAAES